VCQIQKTASEFPNNAFIIVGWEAPLIGFARSYIVLVETGHNFVWDLESMMGLHSLFYNKFRRYTESISESWTLGNNTKIKVITGPGGDGYYNLKITIREDELDDENTNYPIQFAP
jgi:hypothetical protein